MSQIRNQLSSIVCGVRDARFSEDTRGVDPVSIHAAGEFIAPSKGQYLRSIHQLDPVPPIYYLFVHHKTRSECEQQGNISQLRSFLFIVNSLSALQLHRCVHI